MRPPSFDRASLPETLCVHGVIGMRPARKGMRPYKNDSLEANAALPILRPS